MQPTSSGLLVWRSAAPDSYLFTRGGKGYGMGQSGRDKELSVYEGSGNENGSGERNRRREEKRREMEKKIKERESNIANIYQNKSILLTVKTDIALDSFYYSLSLSILQIHKYYYLLLHVHVHPSHALAICFFSFALYTC